MWKSDLDNKVLLPNGQPIPAVLLANKVILIDNQSYSHYNAYSAICPVKGFWEMLISWMIIVEIKVFTRGSKHQPKIILE